MNHEQKSTWVGTLLLAAWLLVVVWQITEHRRVVEAAKADLRNRSHEIASTLSAVTRALRFRGTLFQDRLDPVLNELASVRSNALVSASQLLAVGLLNNEGDTVVAAGEIFESGHLFFIVKRARIVDRALVVMRPVWVTVSGTHKYIPV